VELIDWLHLGIVVGVFCFDTVVGIHALVSKREPRAAVAWTGLCFLVPLLGGVLYILFGVNRIRTRARKLQERGRFDPGEKRDYRELQAELAASHPDRAESMAALIRISERVGGRPLLDGNRVQPLFNGDNAYPAMLEAIRNAEHSVYLCSYMFDTDAVGREFVDALAATAARGVDVRVIVDGVGEYYARGTRVGKLLCARQAVKFAAFLPPRLSPRGLRINLRLHRKILVVDHRIGFTGGINIGGDNVLEDPDNSRPIADLHFRIDGPAVLSLEDVFLEDWYFCTGEPPHFDDCKPAVEPAGDALCRGISDGPNEDFQVLTWILVGALGVARERVQIVTPYFLPDRELLAALTAAALRGVQVDVILPERSNLPPIAWAAQDRLVDVLEYGVRVYYQPPPFSHTKLLVMDDFYVLLGSANLDPRSLRLNFEFNVEVFDPALAAELSAWFDAVKERSREVTREELAGRSSLVVLRDSLAKLLSPYL
jgi:cardiolipin synthase